MDRRVPRHNEEEHTQLQRMGSLVKSVSYIIGMIILAPIVLNKIGKAVDSDIKFKFDFYEIAKGAK